MEQFPPELWCDVDSVNVLDHLDVCAGANLFAAAPAAEFHLRRVHVFNILLLLCFYPQLVLHYSLHLKFLDLNKPQQVNIITGFHHKSVRLTHLFVIVGLF